MFIISSSTIFWSPRSAPRQLSAHADFASCILLQKTVSCCRRKHRRPVLSRLKQAFRGLIYSVSRRDARLKIDRAELSRVFSQSTTLAKRCAVQNAPYSCRLDMHVKDCTVRSYYPVSADLITILCHASYQWRIVLFCSCLQLYCIHTSVALNKRRP